MQLLIVFIITAFVLGATPVGRPLLRRPVFVLAGSTVVASLFYSYRVIA